MITLISVTEEHLNRIQDEEIRTLLRSLTEDQKKHAYAIELDGKPVAIGALNVARQGVGMAWLLQMNQSAIPKDKALVVVREIKKQLKRVAKQEELFRIQATCVADDTRGGRFLQTLGFQAEGVLRQYGPDKEDHIMWSTIYA